MRKFNSIVLIDDDNVNNFINYRLIKRLNISDRIDILESAREALLFLDKLHSNCNISPELIFLDIHMPGMDGYEFVETFNKRDFIRKEKIKIVALSTSAREHDVNRMKNLGVDCFLTKPLTEDKITQIIKPLLLCSFPG